MAWVIKLLQKTKHQEKEAKKQDKGQSCQINTQ